MSEPTPPSRTPEPLRLAGAELDALFQQVAARTVDHRAGARDRLRELPTPTRLALVSGLLLVGMVISAVAQGIRPDLDAAGWQRFAMLCAPFVVVGTAMTVFALWPWHRRPLGGLRWPLAVATLASGVLAALAPIWPGIMYKGPGWGPHINCFVGSTLTACALVVPLLVLDRADRPRTWALLVGAGIAGVITFVAQTAHCPIIDLPHLLFTHGFAGVVAGLLAALIVALRR